jgi:hypothetical protein
MSKIKTFDLQIDSTYLPYPAILLATSKAKIKHNLAFVPPIEKEINKREKANPGRVFLVSSFCDTVIFYIHLAGRNPQMYFLPTFTPPYIVHEIFKLKALEDQFYEMVEDIKLGHNPALFQLQFISDSGPVVIENA